MILCKEYVPDIYTESEDFLCVLRLLDLVANTEKARNRFIDIRNPYQCPSTYLALAARYVGYEYDNQLTEDDNRLIMSVYPTLKRYKGSMYGLELAVKTAIHLSGTLANAEKSIITYTIKVGTESSKYEIEVTISCQQFSQKLVDLLNYVKPVGYTINAHRSDTAVISGAGILVGSKTPTIYETNTVITTDRYNTTTSTNQATNFYEISFNTDLAISNFNNVNIFFDVTYTKSGDTTKTKYGTTIQLYYEGSEWKLKDCVSGASIGLSIPTSEGAQKIFTNVTIKENTEYLQQFLVQRYYSSSWDSVEFGQGHAEYVDASSNKQYYMICKIVTAN